jgi:hypothetical protein
VKFIITVIFILSSGERIVDTAYTAKPQFCQSTADLYNQLGDLAQQNPGGQLQDVVAFCRPEGDENRV